VKTKDERNESKALKELRKENIRLKRQIKEMRKEIRQEENDDSDEPQPEILTKAKEPRNKFSCRKCGSYSVEIFEVVNRDYFKCQDCGSKGRVAQ
jgi:late competence protein required for DNA uptake (superfamily II DNA/RNA helicase)